MAELQRIQTVPDLQAAVKTATQPETRRQIYARAQYLGLVTKLPSNWNSDGTLKDEGSEDATTG